jgi:hypothetical protein
MELQWRQDLTGMGLRSPRYVLFWLSVPFWNLLSLADFTWSWLPISISLYRTAGQSDSLELQPSDGTSTLRGFYPTLIEASLDSAPHYRALSYTWGSLDLSECIYCDGKILPVTANCKDVLRHLRSKTQSLTLWIDAICIDQDSKEERSQQAQLTGDVYKTAQQVLV